MVKLDIKIFLLLRNKLELIYDLEKFLDKIEQIKKDHYEGKVEIESTQDIIFNKFIQKNINEILF